MNRGVKAMPSGGVAFVVITSVGLCHDGDRSHIDAMTIGGLTGGVVALGIWIAGGRNPRSDATSH